MAVIGEDEIIDGVTGEEGDGWAVEFDVLGEEFEKIGSHEPIDWGRREGSVGGLGGGIRGDGGNMARVLLEGDLFEGSEEIWDFVEETLAELVQAEGIGAVVVEGCGVLLAVDERDGGETLFVESYGSQVASGARADYSDAGRGEGG